MSKLYKMTLNYLMMMMMVERYTQITRKRLASSNPGCEISSPLDRKLARWSTTSYVLAMACRPSVSKKKRRRSQNSTLAGYSYNNLWDSSVIVSLTLLRCMLMIKNFVISVT